jgi:hypothetical protein
VVLETYHHGEALASGQLTCGMGAADRGELTGLAGQSKLSYDPIERSDEGYQTEYQTRLRGRRPSD